MKFTVREQINCDPVTFWKVFATEDFVQAAGNTSGALETETVAQDGAPPSAFSRTVRTVRPVDVPGPAKKILGETQTMVETGTFDPESGTWCYTVKSGTMADKVTISGVQSVEERADGTVDKVNELDVTVKIFGVGAMVEKLIEGQIRKGEVANARALNELLANRTV